MLILPIKKHWYNMILSGEKKEEYREIKPYWAKRFVKAELLLSDNHSSAWAKPVLFRNGYGANKPSFVALCQLNIGYGREEWGAEPNKKYFVLNIIKISEVKS